MSVHQFVSPLSKEHGKVGCVFTLHTLNLDLSHQVHMRKSNLNRLIWTEPSDLDSGLENRFI